MKRIFVICHLTFVICFAAFAQSNLTYSLRVGATRDVTLLEDFPESFAGEKVNIKLGALETIESLETLGTMDFVFADRAIDGIATWGDSVYSYTDESEVRWTVWQNKKEVLRLSSRSTRKKDVPHGISWNISSPAVCSLPVNC